MYRRSFIILIIFLYTLVVVAPLNLKRQKRIVGGRPAAKPIIDDPVVYVTRNNRQARIYGSRDSNRGFYVFRGIRFGLPPVGQHRFQVSHLLSLSNRLFIFLLYLHARNTKDAAISW